MANKKVRVLVACSIGGFSYSCDDVVSLPDNLVKAHADSVDTNKEAVAYALSVNGGKVIEHADPNATQKAELEAQIAQLEADLAAAEEAVKPAILESLAAAKASLANLG